MPAVIRRLDPHREQRKAHFASVHDAAQLVLGLELPDEVRAEIANAVYRLDAEDRPWTFVMISTEQVRFVIKAIQTGTARPAIVQRVWMAALTHMHMDTGEVMADRRRLADDAMTTPQEVSRAMSALVEIKAMIREQRGRHPVYLVNPRVGWAGSESKRKAAAARAPRLVPVA